MDIVETLLDDSAFRFAFAMAGVETFADYNLKLYAQTDNTANILASTTGYAGIVYLFQRALRKDKLFRVNNYWNALTSLSNTIVGVSMGEEINQTQMLGVALIVTGILLV
jgi:hypothetical protein